jgi:hypothetical protein
MLVNLTKHNKEINYTEINLSYIRAYLKQVEELNLITKIKTSITINLIAKTKTLTTFNLIAKIKTSTTINLTSTTIKMLTKTKIATNLLTIANKY